MRIIWRAESIIPHASKTTSAPSGGIIARTCSIQSPSSAHTVLNPISRASARRSASTSSPVITIDVTPSARAASAALSPIGPGPSTTQLSPALRLRLLDRVQSGARTARAARRFPYPSTSAPATNCRPARCSILRMRRPDASASRKVETPGAAGAASPAMPEWIERDMIAGLEAVTPRADFDNLAGRLVTDDRGSRATMRSAPSSHS